MKDRDTMAGNPAEDKRLYVRMLGGFSLQWDGKAVMGGGKSSESQFACLMQCLLHNRGEGVGRDRMEELLFGEREIRNVHHAMQSVVYNAKKKLRQAGLPDVNYIELRKGVFHWTEEVPVEEDAWEFDRLCREADAQEDAEERLGLRLAACHLYGGEFLPMQAGVIWAAREARRYREQFCRCVEDAAELLREKQDYPGLERLGVYASRISPLSDWEAITMEALTSMGRYEEARRLYDDTAAYYLEEQGLRPSGRLTELLGCLAERMNHRHAALGEIQSRLSGKQEARPGGYLCSYPVFQGIYRMVERMMERGGQSVYLMLCTVVDSKGNPMREGPMLEELSERLEEAVCSSVRHSDAVNRYGRGQYLVLLVNTTLEDCRVVQRRINEHFIVGRQRTGIQYYVSSVFRTPEEWERRPGGKG